MKTNRSYKMSLAGLFAAALILTQFTSQAIIVGPYAADANTLHLWHMDASAVPVPDAVASGGTNVVKIVNGATLGNASYSGFGNALSTLDGGQNGVAAADKDAYATPSSAASPGNVAITLADPTTGAFTMEAIVWIGFDPAKNYDATASGGNGRSAACQIMTGESSANGNRVFQFRISPIGTVSHNATVNLDFANVHGAVNNQLVSFPIPTTGDDAIVSNNWYHVAVAYNGDENTADNFTVYWTLLDPSRTNATVLGTTSLQFDLITAPTVFSFGALAGRSPIIGNFLGLIDEVRISKIARASSDMMFALPNPVITSQPADQNVALGQPASFSVTVSGAATLVYQWRLYGTNVPGATTNTYSIAATQSKDAGPYDVVVANSYDTVTSAVATLTVGSPVTITSQPVGQVLAVGQNAALSVTADGAATLVYQWRQSGTNVPGATQSAYSIASAKLTDGGPYDVVVTNNYGRATSTVATLTVRIPLNLTWLGLSGSDWDTSLVNWVTDTSANVAYTPGDNVTFDLNGSGAPSVNLTGPLSPSAVVVNAANDYTFSSTVGGGVVGVSRLTKSGTGTLVLDTDNSYNGPTLVQGGILQLGLADAHGTLGTGPVTNNAAIVVNRTGTVGFNNTLAGTGSLTNVLAATISITGTNTLSGPIVLNAGTLSLAGPQAAGNSTAAIFNAASTLALSGGVTLRSNLTLSMLGTTAVPDVRCNITTANDSSTNILNGPIVLGGNGSVQLTTGNGELDINGSVSAPDFTGKYILRGTGIGHIYGNINLPSADHISTTDSATWILHSAGHSFTNSNIGGGTLRLAINNPLPSGLILQVTGKLDLGGFNQQIGALTGTGTVTNSSATSDSILTVNAAQPSAFSGMIKDAAVGGGPGKVGLTLAGGTLTLSGNNVYAGDTTINAGTLALSGAGTLNSTNGNIIIAAGATFDVSGVTSPPYHIRTHKTLIAGGVSGGATINGALVENGGGFLVLTYVSGTPAINVTGGELTLSGCDTTVTVSGAALGVGSYKLISAGTGGSVAGTLPSSVTVGGSGVTAGNAGSLRITGGELWLDVAPAAATQPVITSTSYDGSNLIMSGNNGTEGRTYYVLASPVLVGPLSGWPRVSTNVFAAGGLFSVTNPVSHAIPARFYVLQVP